MREDQTIEYLTKGFLNTLFGDFTTIRRTLMRCFGDAERMEMAINNPTRKKGVMTFHIIGGRFTKPYDRRIQFTFNERDGERLRYKITSVSEV